MFSMIFTPLNFVFLQKHDKDTTQKQNDEIKKLVILSR